MFFLLVDQEEKALQVLARCIKTEMPDSTIYTFTNAKEALQFGLTHQVDVMFTEVQMQGVNGYTLTKSLRKKNPRLFVSFITDTGIYAFNAFQVFANDYIVKPVTNDRLKETLQLQKSFMAG